MTRDALIPLLNKAYSAELETVQNYLANSVWIDGLKAQEVVEALAEDIDDELGHARKLAQRLKELGACPPGSLSLQRTQTSLQPSSDSTDLGYLIDGVIEAETEAVATYRAILDACKDDDPVTADLAVHILADEEKHKCLFEGFRRSMGRDA